MLSIASILRLSVSHCSLSLLRSASENDSWPTHLLNSQADALRAGLQLSAGLVFVELQTSQLHRFQVCFRPKLASRISTSVFDWYSRTVTRR